MIGAKNLISRANEIPPVINTLVAYRDSEIKNFGSLNSKCFYFRSDGKGNAKIIKNSNAKLSATDKYYTVAADVIVFNNSRSHVLMEFRCPHAQGQCDHNIIDNTSFQYKGCLGTPGGFFDAEKDLDENGSPDFFKLAKRQIIEQEIAQEGAADKIQFSHAAFNNYRDIRWKFSPEYVPTVALQFAVTLDDDRTMFRLFLPNKTFPKVRGMVGTSCQKSYWIDMNIIKFVYKKHCKIFDMMHDEPFSDEQFEDFVKSNLNINSEQKPLNKPKSENQVLNKLQENEFVINFIDRLKDQYHFNDFAFDHIWNVVQAYNSLCSSPPALHRSISRRRSTTPSKFKSRVSPAPGKIPAGKTAETLGSLANPIIKKKLEEMTKAVVIVIAGIKKKNNIKPFLEDLESGNTTLDCFLEKFGDIFQDGQNSPGTDGINWDGLQFFGSIIDDVSSVSPVLKLSSLVIFAGYLVATAPEKHRHEIQELAKRFTNLVKDIDSIQEAKASMLDGFPKTKKLLLDRIDDLMCPLINAAEICIYAKFDVWSSIMDELKVKKAQESLQVAQDLLFAVQLNTLVVVDSKIDASLTKIDTTGTQIDTTVTRIDANVTQFNEKFYGQLSDINDKVTLSIDLNKILLQRIKKSRNSAAFDYEEVISSDYESSFFDVGSNFDKALPVMTKVPNTKVVENCMVTKTISELDITGGILYQVYEKAPEIKNSGYLNKKYHYFRNGSLVNDYVTELTDTGPASTKYYSLTTDTVVFNPSCSHVLMIFRCPHLRVDALVGCEHNKLEKNAPFQYKGCLGTPGTFFDGKKDIHTDKTPNYVGFAQRQFIESLKPLGDKYSANINSLSFIGPQFNNYRDIRWYTATNYVPALALQFVTVLQNDISGEIVDLPPLKNVSGRGGVCAPAYWVDLKIIESIYAEHRQIFDMFDSPFDEKTFKHFVQMKTHFVHDEDAHRPRNKLMEENGLLAGLETNQYIINFDSGREYQPHDIAFDHVVNIIRAWSFIKNRGAAAKQN